MTKISIISRPENGSPKVLAQTLHAFFQDKGLAETRLYYKSKVIKRLLSSRDAKYSPIKWFLYKLASYFEDRKLLKEWKKSDAIILCETTPNVFYNHSYNFRKFKEIMGSVPFIYYAVQYLGNSPTIIERLENGGHKGLDEFDWHLSVSDVTELRTVPKAPWSHVGLYLRGAGIKPEPKEEFLALVDFTQPGHEEYREMQIKVLEELNIPYIALEGRYPVEEIREYYKKAAVYLIQSREAFGLPIAECLANGSYVIIKDSSWPMSWRLDEKTEIHGPGTLPDCFVNCETEEILKEKLIKIRMNFDRVSTPEKVFNTFITHYPQLYDGNQAAVEDLLKRIEKKDFS